MVRIHIYNNYNVISTDYVDDGVLVRVVLDEKGKGMYASLIVNNGDNDGN